MTPFLPLAVLIISAWTILRSLPGLMGGGDPEERIAATTRVDRRQGLRMAKALQEKTEILAQASLSPGENNAPGTRPVPVDDRVADLDQQIADMEAERQGLIEEETRREERIRTRVYVMDLAFAAAGASGIIVALVAFVMMLL